MDGNVEAMYLSRGVSFEFEDVFVFVQELTEFCLSGLVKIGGLLDHELYDSVPFRF